MKNTNKINQFDAYLKRKAKNYSFKAESSIEETQETKRRNLTNNISPIQFQRLRVDIKSWRDAITEAEHAYYPHRVLMQRIFQDTILNGHVFSCYDRRKNLTLLRDFKICDDKGNESLELKELFRNNKNISFTGKELASNWFDNFSHYVLDSIFYGYSLISLGDVENESFSNIELVKRWNVSPDRKVVSPYIYALSGKSWEDEDVKDWHIYVSTPSEVGSSQCGFGLLYKVAPYEILLRNNLGYNADFNEMFNQPLRVGHTTKTDETERAEFEALLRDLGSNAYAMLDDSTDRIEMVESKSIGASYLSYSNFEERAQKIISKIILGHADAMDSVPGKLGTGTEISPAQKSLEDIQVKDGILVSNVVNKMLIPRMIKLGFKFPTNYHFEYSNDKEQKEVNNERQKNNKEEADIALKMKLAGLQMDAEYFTKQTGIPATVLLTPVDIQEKKLEEGII